MTVLRPVKLNDKIWIDPILKSENSYSGDFCFSNIYLWRKCFNPVVAKCNDRLLIKLFAPHGTIYSFPVGSGELKKAIDELKEDSLSTGCELRIRGITKSNMELLEKEFPDRFNFVADRNAFDYVYLAEKLATLSGKKLHAKRNFVNRFTENDNWTFERMAAENVQECIAMAKKWESLNNNAPESGLDFELEALLNAFAELDSLKLEGGVLCQNGQVVAFTIGEKLCSDTYIVHYEKAFAEIPGTYATVNREFVRMIKAMYPEIVYINREEDMGNENLRKAKLSYHPEFMVEKYTAIEK